MAVRQEGVVGRRGCPSPCVFMHVFADRQMCLHVNMHAYIAFHLLSRVIHHDVV